MRCACKVGPGRLEGEGPLTALVHEWDVQSGGGNMITYGDGSWAAIATRGDGWITSDAPFTAQERIFLMDEGYCGACIDAMVEALLGDDIQAITYGAGSSGFLWSTTWSDEAKAWEAFDADAADMEDAEEED